MDSRPKRIPRTLKELAIAEYLREYFALHASFPSNEEIVEQLKCEFAQGEVGPLYPKDITNLKKGAYKLLDVNVALPRNGAAEVQLRETFDFDGAMVVGSPYRSYDPNVLRHITGYQAAQFFDENVRDGETVTFSCSLTIRELIKGIHERYTNLRVLTDCVVAVDEFHIMSPQSIVTLFLDRFPNCKGTAFTLPPGVVEILGRQTVQEMLDKALFLDALQANWVFLGIGTISRELSGAGITPGFDVLTHIVTQDAAALQERGTVGEISYWPFDREGTPVFRGRKENLSYFRHVFAHSDFDRFDRGYRQRLGSRTRVVGVAGGQHKVQAIKAAARFLDYLVTDVRTAEMLLA